MSKSDWISHASGAKQAFSREYEKERNGIGEKMIGGPGKDQLWGSSWWRRGLFRWPRLSMIVFASRRFGRSHSFPVAWKWEHRRLEAVFISQTLSLSKKFERKSKEFEVGTYILLEIDWSERWEVEPWSEDKVWCENICWI